MMKTIPAVAIIAFGLAGAPAALADSQGNHMPKSEEPATGADGMPGMNQGAMPGHGMRPGQGMMPGMNQGATPDQGPGQDGDMMGMMTMMSQMTDMMEACTKMMQAMTPNKDMRGDPAPDSAG